MPKQRATLLWLEEKSADDPHFGGIGSILDYNVLCDA